MKLLISYLIYLAIWTLPGCTGSSIVLNSSSALSVTATASPGSGIPAGVRAVKVIFQQSTGGSFDAPPSSGTTAAVGSGLQISRVFNADGTLLASGGVPSTPSANTSWPAWLNSFEIGISGASNASALNPSCAGFASATEASTANCIVGTSTNCGAPSGIFRVSEVDCTLGTGPALAGTGGPADGVYFRAGFSRNPLYLGLTENILVVLEYSTSTVNPAPASPATCFTSGKFTPESCSDFVWKAFAKHSASELAQPFLMLIPPTFSSVLGPGAVASAQTSGTGIASKQFFLPFAGDALLTTLQVSRISSNFPGSSSVAGTAAFNLLHFCTLSNATPGNSPFCAGVVLYSVTFYRI